MPPYRGPVMGLGVGGAATGVAVSRAPGVGLRAVEDGAGVGRVAVGDGGDTGSVLGVGVETEAGVKLAAGLIGGEGVGDLEQARSSAPLAAKPIAILPAPRSVPFTVYA